MLCCCVGADEGCNVSFAAHGWEHTLMVKPDGSVQQLGWRAAPVSGPHATDEDTNLKLPSWKQTGELTAPASVVHDIPFPDQQVVMVAAGETHR